MLSCSESATGSALVFSLELLLVPRPALPSRLNFIEQLASTITIRCGGRPCSARFVGLLSALDFTGFWVLNSQSYLAFSLPQARYSLILAVCGPVSIMHRLAGLASR